MKLNFQKEDMELFKIICTESFPVQYPSSWYEEVFFGKLISFGISCDDDLVAILVAECKLVSECNSEVLFFLFFY